MRARALLLAALALGCADGGAPPEPLRPDGPARVTAAPRSERTLFRLAGADPSRLWVVDARTGVLDRDTETVTPTPAGAVALGPAMRALLVAVRARAGGRLRVDARVSGDAEVHLLESATRPRSAMQVRVVSARGHWLATHALPVDDGVVAAEVALTPRTRHVVVAVRGAGVRVDALELAVRGDDGRRDAPFLPVERDKEWRAAVVLDRAADLALDLPALDRPRRAEIGLVRPATQPEARVTIGLERPGGALALHDGVLAGAPNPDAVRWTDLALPLPPGPAGTLRLRFEPPAGRRASLAVSAPVLLADDGSARATPERPNLLLISIDTLRADALTRNGGHPEASPALDAFAERAAVFETTVAPAAYTLPSHVTMFSGQQPTVHGVVSPDGRIVPGRTPLLTEAVRALGVVTAAYTGGGYLDRRYGFGAGFDRYSQRDPIHRGRDDVLRWLDAHADQRFFLFVHTYAVHEATKLREPYLSRFDADCAAPRMHGERRFELADEPLTPERRAHLERCYAGAVRRADDGVGAILDRLDALGLRERTIVAITSDHGQEIGERGGFLHGHSVYDEMLLVPLMLAGPGVGPPRSIDAQVGVVDLAPTLLDLLGLPPDARMQGRSLVPLLRGRARPPAPILAEAEQGVETWALRWPDRKVVFAEGDEPAWSAYDLADDPAERTARPPRPESAQALEERLRRWRDLAGQLEAAHGSGQRALSPDEVERLQALGYLGG